MSVIKFPGQARDEQRAYLRDLVGATRDVGKLLALAHGCGDVEIARQLAMALTAILFAATYAQHAFDPALVDEIEDEMDNYWRPITKLCSPERLLAHVMEVGMSAPKPEPGPRPHEKEREAFDMASHLGGELLACWSGKASLEQMKACAHAARLALALTELWVGMGASPNPPDEMSERELDEFYRRAREFLKLSADLVTTLHELSAGTILLDNTNVFKLAGVHAMRADRVLALSATKHRA